MEVVVASGISSVVGLALDWITKNLYFTAHLHSTINVVRLKSPGFKDRRVLIKDLRNPRTIVVHPIKG